MRWESYGQRLATEKYQAIEQARVKSKMQTAPFFSFGETASRHLIESRLLRSLSKKLLPGKSSIPEQLVEV
jgi:hypothetical protein